MGIGLFIVGYFRGYSILDAGIASIALAVAAIPEGLPATITIAAAIGVRRMARRKRLYAIYLQLKHWEAQRLFVLTKQEL